MPSLVRLVLCSLVVFFVGGITVESNLTYRLVNHELCYLPFFFDKPYIYVENSNTHIGIKHVLACMKASTWRSSQELQPQTVHVPVFVPCLYMEELWFSQFCPLDAGCDAYSGI